MVEGFNIADRNRQCGRDIAVTTVPATASHRKVTPLYPRQAASATATDRVTPQ